MQHSVTQHDHTMDLPVTRQVTISAPIRWLAAGWHDFRSSPLASGFYGLVFVALGYLVTAASWELPILMLTFVTGFFLLAPFLALGLYDLSRQREQTQKVSLLRSMLAFSHNRRDVGLLVIFHALVMIAWIRLATLLGALYFVNSGNSVTIMLERLWQSGEGLEIIALFTLSGAILAAVVFITSAVSWPMILDRRNGVINAMATSIKVVSQNKAVMLLWAAIIGVLFLIGVATFYIGLLVIIPVLGHATWHAYRELVEKG